MYRVDKKELEIVVAGAEFSRNMKEIFGGPDNIRTMIFPNTVRTVRQGAFRGIKSLKSVMLNEGLETLGTDECSLDQRTCCGVF